MYNIAMEFVPKHSIWFIVFSLLTNFVLPESEGGFP